MTHLRIPPQSISERIEHLSLKIESMEKQLIQSQRLATLGTLSMMLAHEVNNQLMAVINHADIALSSDREDARSHALEKILSSSEMSSSMIRNMLGFGASSDTPSQRINAAQLMEDTLNLMARKPTKDGIEVTREFDPNLWVEGPPVELMQVLLNLIMNATQAMADTGGTLTLRVYTESRYTALEVNDTGPGIGVEQMDVIFDPFFTTKQKASGSSDGGTGLGLYIARNIARKCGGDIAVLSRPGRGARFTVYLPAAEPEADAAPGQDAP